MQSELKPCPFCGSDNICPSSWDIQCQGCKAMMPGEPEDASSRWNRRALTAALSDQERAVEVKALRWVAHNGDENCRMAWTAETFGGHYGIEHRHDGHYDLWWPNNPNGERHEALKSAQSAAQADYEQRIRSALVDVPVEPVAFHVRIKGWGEELLFTEDGAKSLVTRLRRTKSVEGETTITPLYPRPPHREGEDSAEVKRRFHVEWLAGARPPVHPEPMVGRTTFDSFDEAISHMCNQAEDAAFISLEERITTTVSVDRSADARAALAATRSASATSAKGCAE